MTTSKVNTDTGSSSSDPFETKESKSSNFDLQKLLKSIIPLVIAISLYPLHCALYEDGRTSPVVIAWSKDPVHIPVGQVEEDRAREALRKHEEVKSKAFQKNNLIDIGTDENGNTVQGEAVYIPRKAERDPSTWDGRYPCKFVMAPSLVFPGTWGVFSLFDLEKGQPLPMTGDPVIPLVDVTHQNMKHPGLDNILYNYTVSSSHLGSNVEGKVVYSVPLGLSAVVNKHGHGNILPHEGFTKYAATHGERRDSSFAAGSSTSYQEFAHVASQAIRAGTELVTQDTNDDTLVSPEQNEFPARDLAWLAVNGYCIDHVRPKAIPNKGHGVVAARKVPEGATITNFPMLPLHRDALSQKDAPHHQLLLNYAFGHKESSILLIPYGPAVSLLNHDETPNAELRWEISSAKLLESYPFSVLGSKGQEKMVASLVALEEIEPDTEITINYGGSWEKAWREHREKDNQASSKKRHIYADEMAKHSSVLRTVEEQQNDAPYPAHLQTLCAYSSSLQFDVLKGEGLDHAHYLYQATHSHAMNIEAWLPCTIWDRRDGDNDEKLYTVQLHNSPNALDGNVFDDDRARVVHDMPRKAISWAPRPYTSDMFLPTAFRHEMRAIDYPAKWLDLKK